MISEVNEELFQLCEKAHDELIERICKQLEDAYAQGVTDTMELWSKVVDFSNSLTDSEFFVAWCMYVETLSPSEDVFLDRTQLA